MDSSSSAATAACGDRVANSGGEAQGAPGLTNGGGAATPGPFGKSSGADSVELATTVAGAGNVW